jgi:predicted short-subunit dehydrogenase-like oxidoreductase (DUF2520 family)
MDDRGKLRVFVFGAGKVGRALASALRRVKWPVTLRAARKGLPHKPIDADVVVLALRDRELAETVTRLRDTKGVSKRAVVVHCSGALRSDVLAPLRDVCAGVAQMHPMISFASLTFVPSLDRGNVHVEGDRVAAQRATRLAKAIGMTPRHFPKLDTVGYHAAAALLANGAAALAAQAAQVLSAANVPTGEAPKLLGALLRSVAENVEKLGFPDALTGPVRRGDPAAIERGAATLAARTPNALPLYRAAVLAQVPLARALGEVPSERLDAIEKWARNAPATED